VAADRRGGLRHRAAEIDVEAAPAAGVVGRREARALGDAALHRFARPHGAQRGTLTAARAERSLSILQSRQCARSFPAAM